MQTGNRLTTYPSHFDPSLPTLSPIITEQWALPRSAPVYRLGRRNVPVHQQMEGIGCVLVLGLVRCTVCLSWLGSGREWLPLYYRPLFAGLASMGSLYWILSGLLCYFTWFMSFSHYCLPRSLRLYIAICRVLGLLSPNL